MNLEDCSIIAIGNTHIKLIQSLGSQRSATLYKSETDSIEQICTVIDYKDKIYICGVRSTLIDMFGERLGNRVSFITTQSILERINIKGIYSTFGVDRLLNIVSVMHQYPEISDCTIIDFGTFTTVSGISKDSSSGLYTLTQNEILLGITRTMESISSSTSDLPSLSGDSLFQGGGIWGETEQALYTGILNNIVSLVKRFENKAVIITGGWTESLRSASLLERSSVIFEPDLQTRGIIEVVKHLT